MNKNKNILIKSKRIIRFKKSRILMKRLKNKSKTNIAIIIILISIILSTFNFIFKKE